MSRIWLSRPHMCGSEEQYVQRAFAENWIAPLGRNVDEFEVVLAQRCEVAAACALNSGTAGIHLGLRLLGVEPTDTVFVQSLTFAASAFPVTYLGARPVFIDSEPDTWNMSPEALERALQHAATSGTLPKAIVVVDLYGQPANYEKLLPIAQRYQVPILEDAAEALGSTYQGKPCGSFGELAVLSFNGNKIITTSGGGALLTHDPELAKKARYLATQAKTPRPYYWHEEVGYNYRLSNVCAGIGLGQLEVLPQRVWQRREIFQTYRDLFTEVALADLDPDFVNPQQWNHGVANITMGPDAEYSNHWLSTITVDGFNDIAQVSEVVSRMDALDIEVRAIWCPMHLQPIFAQHDFWSHWDDPGRLSVSEQIFNSGLCLPSGSDMTFLEQERVTNVLPRVIAQVL